MVISDTGCKVIEFILFESMKEFGGFYFIFVSRIILIDTSNVFSVIIISFEYAAERMIRIDLPFNKKRIKEAVYCRGKNS